MRLIDADALEPDADYDDGEYWAVSIAQICNAPTIEPVRKGKWVDGRCSQCGYHAPYWPMATTYYESKYCPYCGAKMEEGEQP